MSITEKAIELFIGACLYVCLLIGIAILGFSLLFGIFGG